MGAAKFIAPLEPRFAANARAARASQPSAFLRDAFAAEDAPKAIKMLHGTTTLGFIFKHGVIIAVDSRASQGQYVGAATTLPLAQRPPQAPSCRLPLLTPARVLCRLAVGQEGD